MINKVVVIGAGNMGYPVIKATQKFLQKQNISLSIVEKKEERIAFLQKQLSTEIYKKMEHVDADLVVLATKPDDVPALAKQVKITPDTIILSIMAGIKTETIKAAFSVAKVVRCIPNIPCLISEGITPFYPCERITNLEKSFINNFLKCLGEIIEVKKEELIDKATALSAGGPAYVYYIIENLIKIAQDMGFSQEQSWLLATQTVLGSGALLKKRQVGPRDLRFEVMTPNGTTAEAIKVMERENLGKTLHQALLASQNRAMSIDKEIKPNLL